MFNVLAMMLQTQAAQPMQPAYTDNGSILHHMSDALHVSLYRVLSLLIAVLPGLLAFLLRWRSSLWWAWRSRRS